MRRLTTLLGLCVVVSSGTAAAQGEAASGGWHNVFGPFIVQAGHSTTFTLGRAALPLCFEGACLGDNPRVRWGDGQESDLQHQDCATGGLNPMGCLLVGAH